MRTAHIDDSCSNCERCTWNKGPDCGKREHPHCERCGHCLHRHERQNLERLLMAMDGDDDLDGRIV